MTTLTKPKIHSDLAENRNIDVGQRRTLLIAAFGRTKKSPFVWALQPSVENELVDLIQELHIQFWNAAHCEAVGKGSDGELAPIDDALFRIAGVGYGAIEFSSLGSENRVDDSRLIAQLLDVELPLWGKLQHSTRLETSDQLVNQFEQSIGEALDGDGWPLAEVVQDLGVLIASWCRCYRLLDALGYEIDPEVTGQLNGLVYQIARLKRCDGSLMFGTAFEFGSNAFRKKIVECWSEYQSLPFQIKRSTDRELRMPSASSISEWAQAGVLRQGWHKKDNKVAFLFDQRRVAIEVDNGQVLVSGDCTPRLEVDGKQLSLASEIGVSCFLRFDHGDFIELELDFGDYSIARQILLLNDDELLWINDIVQGPANAIQYKCNYSLADANEMVRETENNEFYLRNRDKFTLVLPLFLPEWRSERYDGKLEFSEQNITVSQKVDGMGMSTPLVFDLNPKRSKQPRTWRRLTVAEQMETVGRDVAVAYRVQIGSQQWLYYRTIGPKGNRTFLGQNFADDCLLAKIELDGTVSPVMEVE